MDFAAAVTLVRQVENIDLAADAIDTLSQLVAAQLVGEADALKKSELRALASLLATRIAAIKPPAPLNPAGRAEWLGRQATLSAAAKDQAAAIAASTDNGDQARAVAPSGNAASGAGGNPSSGARNAEEFQRLVRKRAFPTLDYAHAGEFGCVQLDSFVSDVEVARDPGLGQGDWLVPSLIIAVMLFRPTHDGKALVLSLFAAATTAIVDPVDPTYAELLGVLAVIRALATVAKYAFRLVHDPNSASNPAADVFTLILGDAVDMVQTCASPAALLRYLDSFWTRLCRRSAVVAALDGAFWGRVLEECGWVAAVTSLRQAAALEMARPLLADRSRMQASPPPAHKPGLASGDFLRFAFPRLRMQRLGDVMAGACTLAALVPGGCKMSHMTCKYDHPQPQMLEAPALKRLNLSRADVAAGARALQAVLQLSPAAAEDSVRRALHGVQSGAAQPQH